MTDLVKTYNKIAIAKSVAKKTQRENHAIIEKGGLVAIIERPKNRSHRIITPREMTVREFVWQQCNALLASGLDYKSLRANVIAFAIAQGYKRGGIMAEISRWRHRFN